METTGEGVSVPLLQSSSPASSSLNKHSLLLPIGPSQANTHYPSSDEKRKSVPFAVEAPNKEAFHSAPSPSREAETRYRPWSWMHHTLLAERQAHFLQAPGIGAIGPLASGAVNAEARGRKWSNLRRSLRNILKDYVMWGNLFNFLGCLGYVVTDFARGYFNDHVKVSAFAYIVLAWVFVFDSIVYWAAWQGSEDAPIISSRLADCTNILGSLGYAATSIMYPYEQSDNTLFAVVVIETGLAFIYLVCCLAYLKAWLHYLEPTDGLPRRWAAICRIWDPDMWANGTQVAAATTYVAAQIGGLWYYYTYPTNNRKESIVTSQAMTFISKVGLFGDILYAVAAAFYCYVWIRDFRQSAKEQAGADQNVWSAVLQSEGGQESDPTEDPTAGFQPFGGFPRLCGVIWQKGCSCCYSARNPSNFQSKMVIPDAESEGL